MIDTAQKRMFDKSITNSDTFLELPDSSQVLYFHLNMNADDDGFVNNWKSIIRMIGAKEDDLKLLISKSFIIPFDSGVIVIRHWRINNYLRKDRYVETNYKDEFSRLSIGENGEYTIGNQLGIPLVYPDKNSIDKNSIEYKEEEIIKEEENIFDYYQQNIGQLTPNQYERLDNYIKQYGNDRVKEAINIACDNNVRTFKYFESCVKNGKYTFKKKNEMSEPKWLDKENKDEMMSEEELKELESDFNDIFGK